MPHMSRAELRVWCLKQMGWRFIERRVPYVASSLGTYRVFAWSPSELEKLDWAYEGQDKTAVIGSYLGTLEWQSNQSDPTTSIAEAWNLWNGIEEDVSHNVGYHGFWTAKIWGQVDGEWKEAVCHVATRDLIPLAMCAAFYEWKEGERVEIREEL